MTDIIDSVQLLDTGEALIELFEVTLPGYSDTDLDGHFYLFNGGEKEGAQIVFNGDTYSSIPINLTGVEVASTGAMARPSLTVANIPLLSKTLDSSETVLENIRKNVVNVSITGATQADPVVITTAAPHELSDGSLISITGVDGMVQLNDNAFYVDVKTSTTLALYSNSALTTSIDGTSYSAYTSGGFLDFGTLDFPFETNDELIGTRVVYRRTFESHLGSGSSSNPQFPPQVYYIDRVSSENNILVTFELASPMDVEGAKLPARNVIGQYCVWKYQGRAEGLGGGCMWPKEGSRQHAFFRTDDTPILGTINEWDSGNSQHTAGDIVKTTTTSGDVEIWEALFNNNGKSPLHYRKYWKRIDLCGKTLNSCKVRFQGYVKDISAISYASSAVLSTGSSHNFSLGDIVTVSLNPSSSSLARAFTSVGTEAITAVSNTSPNFNITIGANTSSYKTDITDIEWDGSETIVTGTNLSSFISGDPVIIKNIEANWDSVENTIYYLKETSGTYSLYTDSELTTVLDTSALTAYDSSNPTGTIEVTFTSGIIEKTKQQNVVLPFGGFPGAKKFK